MTEKYSVCQACTLALVGTVTVLYFQLLRNVERVSLLDMPTHCALYSVSVTVPLL